MSGATPYAMSESMRIKPDTQSYGVGPLSLDVAMARRHGWTEEMLEGAADEIAKLSRSKGMEAQSKNPHLFYRAPDGTDIFVGDLSVEARIEIVTEYERGRKKP